MTAQVINADCREAMRDLAADSVDAIVTDPPYHLTTGKKGGTGPASDNPNSPAGRARVTTGFMGKAWDGGDIAHDPTLWAEALRVAKPGAHLLAFGGTRTFHRLACAIEDAGFEIRDCVMWVYGSGFPKSLNLRDEWAGWGTALKPAWEPIIVARKPLRGTVAANVQEFGTGALNIDGCRIETDGRPLRETDPKPEANGSVYAGRQRAGGGFDGGSKAVGETTLGRWPANVITDGSDEVVALFPESDGQAAAVGPQYGAEASINTFGDYGPRDQFEPRGDTGSAARFFYCAKADRADRDDGLHHRAAKRSDYRPNDSEDSTLRSRLHNSVPKGNHHPTVKPTDLMRYLCRLVTPPGGTVLDPFCGSGSTGRAALLEGFGFIGIELDPEYAAIANDRIYAAAPLFAGAAD